VLLEEEIVPVGTLDAPASSVRGLLGSLDRAGLIALGELLQEGTTREQIFGVAEPVAWLSRTMTLLPGDIIATGTPAGVGASKGRFLREGEVVEVEVDGLGAVSNRVRCE